MNGLLTANPMPTLKRGAAALCWMALPLCWMALPMIIGESAYAQAVRTGFSGGSLPKVDDVASTAQAIGFTVNFFGSNFSNVYITDNGYVTFDGRKTDFTPEGLRNNTSKIIAPFFADVDTSGAGSQPITWGQGTVAGRRAFAVNWVNVGYYNARTSPLNSFQLVLIDRSDRRAGDFDFEFNYDRIGWEAGQANNSASTGICGTTCDPPSVGYSNGLSGAANVSYEWPGSHVRGAFLDTNTATGLRFQQFGGSGVAGRLLFQAMNGTITSTNPAITGLTPLSAIAGSGPVTLTVDGTGFVSGAVIRWTLGGQTQNLQNVQFVSATRLTATIPASLLTTAGSAQVVVANPTGNPSAFATFTISNPPPAQISFSASVVTSPTDQPTIGLTLSSPATSVLTGALGLTFVSNPPTLTPSGYIDPAVRFASGGATTLPITIAAGTASAVVPGNGQFQLGTVAGTVIVTLNSLTAGTISVLPTPPPSTTVTVARLAPVITASSVRIVNVTSTGFSVEVQGYSTTRELVSATFAFTPASGSALDGTASFTVPLGQSATTAWFDTANGRNNGSRFLMTMPFTFSGDSNAIGTVTVTLTNTVGGSASVSGGR